MKSVRCSIYDTATDEWMRGEDGELLVLVVYGYEWKPVDLMDKRYVLHQERTPKRLASIAAHLVKKASAMAAI